MKWFLFHLFVGTVLLQSANGEVLLSTVKVSCQSGNCFFRKKGSAWNHLMETGHVTEARLGDVVMSVGQGSVVEIVYSDGTKSFLKDTGLFRIWQGTAELLLTQGEESGEGTFVPESASSTPSNLIYFGNMPLNFLTPALGEVIVVSKFPQKILVVFELVNDKKFQEADGKIKSWKLVSINSQSAQEIGKVDFQKISGSTRVFSASIELSQAGSYQLLPMDSQSVEKNQGFSFTLKGSESLEEEVNQLLLKAESNPNGGIELRSQ